MQTRFFQECSNENVDAIEDKAVSAVGSYIYVIFRVRPGGQPTVLPGYFIYVYHCNNIAAKGQSAEANRIWFLAVVSNMMTYIYM